MTTGHRLGKLCLKQYHPEARDRLYALAEATLKRYASQCVEVIVGMADGWDLACCEAALDLGLRVVAAIPCQNQPETFDPVDQEKYFELQGRIGDLLGVPDGKKNGEIHRLYTPGVPCTADCFKARNSWMANRVSVEDIAIALYDEENRYRSGTGHAVRCADRRAATIKNVWPSWVKHSGIPILLPF